MKWILIYVLTTGANFGGGPATLSVEFDTKKACERVLKDLRAKAARHKVPLWSDCYPKGDQ